MKKGYKKFTSRIQVSIVKEGKSIEQVIRAALQDKEPITGNATLLYTDKKDGVHPEMDIRTDRFQMAMMAADRVHASNFAKRMTDMGFEQKDGNWVLKPETPRPQGEA